MSAVVSFAAVGVVCLLAISISALLQHARVNTFLTRRTADGTIIAAKPARRVCVVIAHPDDESMFFLPTLLHLRSQGHTLLLLSLSAGNAAGLGSVRSKELLDVAELLRAEQVRIIEDERKLPDGMNTKWSVTEVERHVAQFVKEEKIDTVSFVEGRRMSLGCNHDLPLTCYWCSSSVPLLCSFSLLIRLASPAIRITSTQIVECGQCKAKE